MGLSILYNCTIKQPHCITVLTDVICLLPLLESSAAASDRTLIDQMSTWGRRRMIIVYDDDREDDCYEKIREREKALISV